MNNNEKDEAVKDIIADFSKQLEKTDIKEYIEKFKCIYKNDYRHSYAKMYGTIADVKKSGNIDYLGENIELLRKTANELPANEISADVRTGINKFYDHVSLECARLSDLDVITNKYKELNATYNQWSKESKNISSSIDRHNKELDRIDKKISNQNKEILSHMIAIISIFTAVVFTALTSFNLITSIASAVAGKDNLYWIGCVLGVVSFITINIFYILLKFISRLMDKSIFAHKNYIITLDVIVGIVTIVLFICANKTVHILPI